MQTEPTLSLKDLYPRLTEAELTKAEANLRRFLAVVIRISERLAGEDFTGADLDLTDSETEARIPPERSIPKANQ